MDRMLHVLTAVPEGRMTNWLFGLLLAVVGVYCLIVAAMYGLQRRLMYHPVGPRLSPSYVGLSGVQDLTLPTPDGEQLVAWWAKAALGKPTLLYFHGNAGHLSERSERIRFFQQRGPPGRAGRAS
jgi:uncharacterized protein